MLFSSLSHPQDIGIHFLRRRLFGLPLQNSTGESVTAPCGFPAKSDQAMTSPIGVVQFCLKASISSRESCFPHKFS